MTKLRRLEGCTHDMPSVPENPVPMAAPYESCKCCGNVFYYIDSFYMMNDKDGHARSGGRSHIRNLCQPCGGGYVERGWQPGERNEQ
jgi:hypothetical protein